MEVQAGTATTGRDIFLVGIIAQGLSYVVYDFLVATSHRGAYQEAERKGEPHVEPWWRVFKLIYFSSVFIIVRCTLAFFPLRSSSLNKLIRVTDPIYLSCGRDGARQWWIPRNT